MIPRTGADAPPVVGVAVRTGSAVLSRTRHIAPARRGFERSMALLVLMIGALGTVGAFATGGVGGLLEADRWSIGLGIAAQVIITGLEWMYSHRRWEWPYLVALGFDAGLTVWGWGPLVAAPVTAWVAVWGGELTNGIAWAILIIAALAIAAMPERTLVGE